MYWERFLTSETTKKSFILLFLISRRLITSSNDSSLSWWSNSSRFALSFSYWMLLDKKVSGKLQNVHQHMRRPFADFDNRTIQFVDWRKVNLNLNWKRDAGWPSTTFLFLFSVLLGLLSRTRNWVVVKKIFCVIVTRNRCLSLFLPRIGWRGAKKNMKIMKSQNNCNFHPLEVF